MALAKPWMRVVAARDRHAFAILGDTLDPGEAEAIVVALELRATLILIDEKRGRQIARTRGLETTGLLGVLAKAKARLLITQCRPIVDEMISGCRLLDWRRPAGQVPAGVE